MSAEQIPFHVTKANIPDEIILRYFGIVLSIRKSVEYIAVNSDGELVEFNTTYGETPKVVFDRIWNLSPNVIGHVEFVGDWRESLVKVEH